MSRAVIHEVFGGLEVLEVREVPQPNAGSGQVRVRVAAAGLNPMDWGIAARPEAAAMFGITVPSGFGSDLAGVIDRVGDGVTGYEVDPAHSVAVESNNKLEVRSAKSQIEHNGVQGFCAVMKSPSRR